MEISTSQNMPGDTLDPQDALCWRTQEQTFDKPLAEEPGAAEFRGLPKLDYLDKRTGSVYAHSKKRNAELAQQRSVLYHHFRRSYSQDK